MNDVVYNNIVYGYEHVPTIKAFSQSNKFIRGLMGPYGSGKSSGCVMELVRMAKKQPLIDGKRRSRFVIIRNTYRQLEDTTIRTVREWLPHHFGDYKKTANTYVVNMILTDDDGLEYELEMELLFRALDRPEQAANLLSLELTGAWINEAREVPLGVINTLKGRVGRFPAIKDGGCIDPGIIMDTNPPDDESWFYRMFEETPADNVELFKQPSALSPEAENLPHLLPSYYANICEGADEMFVRVHVHGEYGFIRDGKPIYPEYSDSVHCKEFDIDPKGIIKRGWDFGLTPACVFTQLSANGRFLILDELVSEDIAIDRFSDVVLEHCAEKYPNAQFTDYGDPAGQSRSETDERTCFDILHGKGVYIQSGKQSPTLRIESVRKPLNTLIEGKPQLLLHPRCKTLRKGFQGRYQYKKLKISGAAERYQEKPDKNDYSHPHDALQYVATMVFGNALKSHSTDNNWFKRPIDYPSAKEMGIV